MPADHVSPSQKPQKKAASCPAALLVSVPPCWRLNNPCRRPCLGHHDHPVRAFPSSVIRHTVVSNRPATDAAFYRAVAVTKFRAKAGWVLQQPDLLVINKTDLAEGVGADFKVMERDTKKMRGSGPFVFAQVKHGVGLDEIIAPVIHAWQHAIGAGHLH